MPRNKKIFEFNGRIIKLQQSAFSFGDAERRIKNSYPHARNFRMLKKMKYSHGVG